MQSVKSTETRARKPEILINVRFLLIMISHHNITALIVILPGHEKCLKFHYFFLYNGRAKKIVNPQSPILIKTVYTIL